MKTQTAYRVIVAALIATAAAEPSAEPNVTQCDRLVAHPSDPDRVSPGVSSNAVDHTMAIAACEYAVANDNTSARLKYQLSRVYFYSGQTDKALPHLEYAADAGYRQAQFVLGYILADGLQGAPKDLCRTEDLWSKSARSGRLAALVSYPHHVLRGRFDQCTVQIENDEAMSFLTKAKQHSLDYYQTLLVDDLIEGMQQRISAAANGQ